LVRSRPDCLSNADNNRCRGDRPPLNTGAIIAWIEGWHAVSDGIIAGLEMRNPANMRHFR
jgi:hypothetical protein